MYSVPLVKPGAYMSLFFSQSFFCILLFPLLSIVWFAGSLWMVEENSEVLLDVGGHLYHVGAHLYIHLPIWKLPRPVAKHDRLKERKVRDPCLGWDGMGRGHTCQRSQRTLFLKTRCTILGKRDAVKVCKVFKGKLKSPLLLCSLCQSLSLKCKGEWSIGS